MSYKTKVLVAYTFESATRDMTAGYIGMIRSELIDSCEITLVDFNAESIAFGECDLIVLIMTANSTPIGVFAGTANMLGTPLLAIYPSADTPNWRSITRFFQAPPHPILERVGPTAESAVVLIKDAIGELGLDVDPLVRMGREAWKA